VIICKLQFFSYSMNQHIQHTCDAQKYMPWAAGTSVITKYLKCCIMYGTEQLEH
jgi:hypothetical protein